jgi:hypothetical protein
MTASQIPHLVRIPHRDLEIRLRRLLYADARLHGTPHRAGLRSQHRRRLSRSRRLNKRIIIDINLVRIRRALAADGPGVDGEGGAQGKLFLDRGSGGRERRIGGCGAGAERAEGAEGVVFDSLETGGLGDEATGCEARGARGRGGGSGCGSRGIGRPRIVGLRRGRLLWCAGSAVCPGVLHCGRARFGGRELDWSMDGQVAERDADR